MEARTVQTQISKSTALHRQEHSSCWFKNTVVDAGVARNDFNQTFFFRSTTQTWFRFQPQVWQQSINTFQLWRSNTFTSSGVPRKRTCRWFHQCPWIPSVDGSRVVCKDLHVQPVLPCARPWLLEIPCPAYADRSWLPDPSNKTTTMVGFYPYLFIRPLYVCQDNRNDQYHILIYTIKTIIQA